MKGLGLTRELDSIKIMVYYLLCGLFVPHGEFLLQSLHHICRERLQRLPFRGLGSQFEPLPKLVQYLFILPPKTRVLLFRGRFDPFELCLEMSLSFQGLGLGTRCLRELSLKRTHPLRRASIFELLGRRVGSRLDV